MLLLALTLIGSDPAWALARPQSGPQVDVAAGLGLGSDPVLPWGAGLVSVQWWFGPYDESYAIGRYWSVGFTGRGDLRSDALRLAPMVEVRRGVDLLVAGGHGFLAGGVLTTLPFGDDDPAPLGATVRAGGGGEFRRHRYWGLTLRLEAGVDIIDSQVGFAGGVLLGLQVSRPAHPMDAR